MCPQGKGEGELQVKRFNKVDNFSLGNFVLADLVSWANSSKDISRWAISQLTILSKAISRVIKKIK